MNKNEVLVVGASSSILLTCSAWLTGYYNNRLMAWFGILAVIAIGSGVAWFSKSKSTPYQEIAKYTAVYGAVVYIVAAIFGLISTRWAHGTWSPELINTTESLISKLFNHFPNGFMKTILHPTFSTVVLGSILMGIWTALGSSFLPNQETKKTSSKKGRK